MKLTPVKDYKLGRYPSLAEYLAGKQKDEKLSSVALAAALAVLAALMSGCSSVS